MAKNLLAKNDNRNPLNTNRTVVNSVDILAQSQEEENSKAGLPEKGETIKPESQKTGKEKVTLVKYTTLLQQELIKKLKVKSAEEGKKAYEVVIEALERIL